MDVEWFFIVEGHIVILIVTGLSMYALAIKKCQDLTAVIVAQWKYKKCVRLHMSPKKERT